MLYFTVISYNSLGSPTLQSFRYTHWGADARIRKPLSGFLFKLGSSVMSWCSKKYTFIAFFN